MAAEKNIWSEVAGPGTDLGLCAQPHVIEGARHEQAHGRFYTIARVDGFCRIGTNECPRVDRSILGHGHANAGDASGQQESPKIGEAGNGQGHDGSRHHAIPPKGATHASEEKNKADFRGAKGAHAGSQQIGVVSVRPFRRGSVGQDRSELAEGCQAGLFGSDDPEGDAKSEALADHRRRRRPSGHVGIPDQPSACDCEIEIGVKGPSTCPV